MNDLTQPNQNLEETVAFKHLRGLIEALLFVSDRPLKVSELAQVAQAENRTVRLILEQLISEYREQGRGFQLSELASGFQLRTSPTYAPFVRELTAQKPVKLSRAQIETLAIIAYRQPITRPEIEDIRGVDTGAVLKSLLERDLIRILGKKDEPGRPLLYGTTSYFFEFFGLKSLRELPTLREFTELTQESRDFVDRELGEQTTHGSNSAESKPSATQDSALELSSGNSHFDTLNGDVSFNDIHNETPIETEANKSTKNQEPT